MLEIKWNGKETDGGYIFDGKELKPKYGANSNNTWVIDGDKVKPKYGANSNNTYKTNGAPAAVIMGKIFFRLY